MAALTALDTARIILTELTRLGVRDAVIAPGSRSAPFAYALAELESQARLRVRVRIDERDAGFLALGLSLSTGRPVPVIMTSGTAVGNLLPAVMEASHAGVPLIVLSADRPEELRGTGSSQTTRQDGLFPLHTRASTEIPAGPDSADSVRAEIRRILTPEAGQPAGPVQINVCFRDPLTPEAGWTPAARPVETPAPESVSPLDEASAPEVVVVPLEELEPRRTVVIAGHGAGEEAALFAAEYGLPLLAEPSSNARFGRTSVQGYRVLVPQLAERIERAVVFGRPTLSRPITRLMSDARIERALFSRETPAWFEEGRRTEPVLADLAELARFAGRGAEGWLEEWLTAAESLDATLQMLLLEGEDRLSGLHVADAVWECTSGNLVLGASNPVRDADLVASPGCHPLQVFANRGVAGIDGTVSTAAGIALGSGVPTRLLLGDVTLLHDVGGLLAAPGEAAPDLQIVVLNDGGGRIFGLLEHGAVGRAGEDAGSAVERFFATPQAVEFEAVCRGYGVEYRRVEHADELFEALAGDPHGLSVVDVRVEAGRAAEMAEAVRERFTKRSSS